MENPVWVINQSDVTLDDIVNLKNGNYDKTNIAPKNVQTKSNEVCPLVVKTICSTTQHDDWANGGSEYVIYWFYPSPQLDQVLYQQSTQIKISRKAISNKEVRTINFYGNFDWSEPQLYNYVYLIEYDPGKNKDKTIDLHVEVLGVTKKLSTTISINNNDDELLKYEVLRSSMLSAKDRTRDLPGSGVTITATLNIEKY